MKIYHTKFKDSTGREWISCVSSETLEEEIKAAKTCIESWNDSRAPYTFEILEYLPTGRVFHPEDYNEDA